MDAAVSIGDFMRTIINPYLMHVNPQFIPIAVDKIDNQLMVNEFSKNLLRLKEERRESWAKIGKAADVSAQAAHKWGAGGNINDDQLEKLARYFDMSKSALKYGAADQMHMPPIIEDDEWNALSIKQREFVETLSLTPLSDAAIDAMKGMLEFIKKTLPETQVETQVEAMVETSKTTYVSPSANIVNTVKPLRGKPNKKIHKPITKKG